VGMSGGWIDIPGNWVCPRGAALCYKAGRFRLVSHVRMVAVARQQGNLLFLF
jgi:hypothetical protein